VRKVNPPNDLRDEGHIEKSRKDRIALDGDEVGVWRKESSIAALGGDNAQGLSVFDQEPLATHHHHLKWLKRLTVQSIMDHFWIRR